MLAPDEIELNAQLREHGIPYDIRELNRNPKLCPDSVPELLQLFRQPFSIYRRVALAEALFARRPNTEQKREIVNALMDLIRENVGRGSAFESIMLNELADNISADKVHELGTLLLDRRYGSVRPAVVEALCKIGNLDAIIYLKKVAKEPGIASYALAALARLRVEETLTLCESALASQDILYKDAIKTTYQKFKRRLEKKPILALHVTAEAIPHGLSEWSTNLDGSEIPKTLKCIQKCLDEGFGKAESSEVRNSIDELSVNQKARFKFNVRFINQDTTLWLEVGCDDEDAYNLYIFGMPALIGRIEKAMKEIL
jgi:hypothetical protein